VADALGWHRARIQFRSHGDDRVYVRDRQAGTTTLVSAGVSSGISNDGRTVLLISSARLVADDTDNDSDVYAKDLATGVITRISVVGDEPCGRPH
jgi:hypothetical protein